MSLSKGRYQQLSVAAIEQSAEIREWLSQFNNEQQATAKTLLSHLKFVSRDEYSNWLRRSIERLPSKKEYALYSVRKLGSDPISYWDSSGKPVLRPATSQGSEDLVYSIISNLVRSSNGRLIDHPSLQDLKDRNVRNIVLVDDSIGSGDRVSSFVNAMLENPTFLSWWSFGWIKITVISYARPRGSESKILDNIRGSDHGCRKFRKSIKVDFVSEVVYEEKWLEERWGTNYKEVLELCRNQKKVMKWARLGYGDVLSNIIFYHSVPNNTPGILWFSNTKWQGLMADRALPGWLINLLNKDVCDEPLTQTISNNLLSLLVMVKKGVRNSTSIAARLNVDHHYASKLIEHATDLGFLTLNLRLTKVGLDTLKKTQKHNGLPKWDYGLYIPSSWCAGQANIQPLTGDSHLSTDSVEAFTFTDGDVGEASLERSDAKAAEPPFSVMPQSPSVSRKSHDTNGPLGSKER